MRSILDKSVKEDFSKKQLLDRDLNKVRGLRPAKIRGKSVSEKGNKCKSPEATIGKSKLVMLKNKKVNIEYSDGKNEVPPGFSNLEPSWDKLSSTLRLISGFSAHLLLCWVRDRETPIYFLECGVKRKQRNSYVLLGMWGRNDWGKENRSTCQAPL